MYSRPKLKVSLTIFDKIVELITGVVLLFMWVMFILNYNSISDIIPIHYNFKGEIDGYGSKGYLGVLVLISTVLYLGMTLLNRYPDRFNYPVKITEVNALEYYTIATRLLRWLKFIMVLIFAVIYTHVTHHSAVTF